MAAGSPSPQPTSSAEQRRSGRFATIQRGSAHCGSTGDKRSASATPAPTLVAPSSRRTIAPSSQGRCAAREGGVEDRDKADRRFVGPLLLRRCPGLGLGAGEVVDPDSGGVNAARHRQPSRKVAEQTDNIVRWHELPRGGHFAAMGTSRPDRTDLRDALRP